MLSTVPASTLRVMWIRFANSHTGQRNYAAQTGRTDGSIRPKPDPIFTLASLGASTDGKRIALLAHMDVVDALPEDWERDPFTLTEADGYFYERGT